MNKTALALIVTLLWGTLFFSTARGEQVSSSTAPSPDPQRRQELEDLIRARAEELEKVNRQLETTEENLRATKDQRVGLQKELDGLRRNISQLELNIQSNEITSQKLGLEIDSLNYDLRDIEISIEQKRLAIAKLLQELQKKDKTNLLAIFLRNQSLADGVLESQSLASLRNQIAIDITGLKELHEEFNKKIGEVGVKRTNIEAHKKNLTVRKSLVQDQKGYRQVLLAQTKSKEDVYAQQFEELKRQQEAISDEISKVEDELRKTFDVSLLPIKRPGVFLWPIASKTVTQHFGERSRLYRGNPHNGLDIGAPLGTPVFAADDGVIMAVDNNDKSQWNKYQYGKYVVIRHGNKLATLYAHLSRQMVKVGDKVIRGDVIGYSGATGYATGPHLHFGAYWAPSVLMKSIPPAAGLVPVGVLVNPENYL